MHNTRVYLAGPDVFMVGAKSFFNHMKQRLADYGFYGVSPFDIEGKNNMGTSMSAEEIYINNLRLVNSSKYVLANLVPFRGASLDVGTAYEIGYATAKGLTVFGYYDNKYPDIYASRVAETDDRYTIVEDFDLFDNLMVIKACKSVHASFDEACKALSNYHHEQNYGK